MGESVRPYHPLTVEEYLALEETATVKHEYLAGNVYAMVGATKRHNRLVGNIYRRLADAAEGGPCQVYMEAVKLRAARDLIYHPDVMVACEPDDDPLIENAPCLLVEVTSPNTEMTDRREKLVAYRQTPGLEAYLIVSQDRRWVEHHFQDKSGKWQRSDLLEEGRISVPCPSGAQLTLDNIHRGIEATS